jgi:DNA-binding transcriptional MocR family regulator
MHGRWLPSERSLATEFAVCRPTIRQAIVELEERRLLQRTAGHRPIVWNQAKEALNGENGTGGNHHSDNGLNGIETGAAPHRVSTAARSIGLWIIANNSLDAGVRWDLGPIALTNGI